MQTTNTTGQIKSLYIMVKYFQADISNCIPLIHVSCLMPDPTAGAGKIMPMGQEQPAK
jgi:hypothetical protein